MNTHYCGRLGHLPVIIDLGGRVDMTDSTAVDDFLETLRQERLHLIEKDNFSNMQQHVHVIMDGEALRSDPYIIEAIGAA
jgi:hypothetical protein